MQKWMRGNGLPICQIFALLLFLVGFCLGWKYHDYETISIIIMVASVVVMFASVLYWAYSIDQTARGRYRIVSTGNIQHLNVLKVLEDNEVPLAIQNYQKYILVVDEMSDEAKRQVKALGARVEVEVVYPVES